MTKREFEALASELKNGENRLLDRVFLKHRTKCIAWLRKKYDCTLPDAEDIFMDALLVFRGEVIKGGFDNRNIGGYLTTVAKNIYLQRLRKAKQGTTLPLDQQSVEYLVGKQEGLYSDDFDPLLRKEAEQAIGEKQKARIAAYRAAWSKLGLPCRKVLTGFYIDKIKLKELQVSLGYSSYDSIKTIRKRCFNQLKNWALTAIEDGQN
ncbi:MAG: hypothetical protein AAFQ37_05710 [Bacteroidota bacterium]